MVRVAFRARSVRIRVVVILAIRARRVGATVGI